jgi:hypothetical protein
MGFGCFESFFACCLLYRSLDQLLDITVTLHFFAPHWYFRFSRFDGLNWAIFKMLLGL